MFRRECKWMLFLPTMYVYYVYPVMSKCRYQQPYWLITGIVTSVTRRVPLVEQELIILPEHASSSPLFSFCHSIFSFLCNVCRSLFILFLVDTLSCLSFDIRILITPLVSSNSSYWKKAELSVILIAFNDVLCSVHATPLPFLRYQEIVN